jgi:endonuclease YncB( thermonuclease family)
LCASSALAGPITVIDGDTVERDGERWRLYNIDAPELHHAHCAAERTLAIKSAARLVALLEARGGRVIDSGKREKYGRWLGRLIIGWPTAGEEPWADIAIREGLAVAWDGRGRAHDWCGG